MKSNGDDTAPPLATVICSVPAFATSPKNIVAVSLDEETNEVARPLPLTRTCAPATKFAPLTVSVNELVPAIASDGLSDRMTGVVTANAFAATRRNASSKVERKVVTPHPQGITDTSFYDWCRLPPGYFDFTILKSPALPPGPSSHPAFSFSRDRSSALKTSTLRLRSARAPDSVSIVPQGPLASSDGYTVPSSPRGTTVYGSKPYCAVSSGISMTGPSTSRARYRAIFSACSFARVSSSARSVAPPYASARAAASGGGVTLAAVPRSSARSESLWKPLRHAGFATSRSSPYAGPVL